VRSRASSETLRGALQGDLRAGGDAGAQEVLDALAAACARGAGRPLAAWAAAAFRAAGALGLPPGDAAALGPRHCLRLLLMRGPAAAPVRPRAPPGAAGRSRAPARAPVARAAGAAGSHATACARRAAAALAARSASMLAPLLVQCLTQLVVVIRSRARRTFLAQPALFGSGAPDQDGAAARRATLTPQVQMQGRPCVAQVAIEFALAHQMHADEAARFIADAFLKARRPPAAGARRKVAARRRLQRPARGARARRARASSAREPAP